MPTSVQITMNRFPELAARLPEVVGEIVQKTILEIETRAKIVVPVDTGALRASLHSEMTGPTSGEVATNMEYAHFVEYGTVRMAAQPYMTPAAELVRPTFMRAMSRLEGRLDD